MFIPSKSQSAAVLLAFGAIIPSTAQSAVLITVDPSNPAAVVFAATGAFSDINDSSSTSSQGVTLEGLFPVDFNADVDVFGTLTPAGAPAPYDYVDNDFSTVTLLDSFIVYRSGGSSGPQVFTTSTVAFTGVATANLTGAIFGVPGTTGDIFVGDTLGGSGEVIGEWQVIPEPSAVILASLASLSLFGRRRK